MSERGSTANSMQVSWTWRWPVAETWQCLWLFALSCGGSMGWANPVPNSRLAATAVDPNKAIESLQRNDWYDKQNREFAPPRDLKDPDDSLRRSDWLRKVRQAKTSAPNSTTSTGSSSWFGWLAGLDSQLINYAVISVVGVLLLLSIFLVSYWSRHNWLPGRYRRRGDFKPTPIDMTKVFDLPFEVQPTRHDPLSEAEFLMRAGRFDEAIVFLFGYTLLALDQANMIQLQRGKTNRMYLRELNGRKSLISITERTMLAFEDVFFGRYSLSRDRFTEIWSQLPAFHELIRPRDADNPPMKVPST